eukprot:scaffold1136_cov260-Pinguiococcus_pyrenoidosus.AAC.6
MVRRKAFLRSCRCGVGRQAFRVRDKKYCILFLSIPSFHQQTLDPEAPGCILTPTPTTRCRRPSHPDIESCLHPPSPGTVPSPDREALASAYPVVRLGSV